MRYELAGISMSYKDHLSLLGRTFELEWLTPILAANGVQYLEVVTSPTLYTLVLFRSHITDKVGLRIRVFGTYTVGTPSAPILATKLRGDGVYSPAIVARPVTVSGDAPSNQVAPEISTFNNVQGSHRGGSPLSESELRIFPPSTSILVQRTNLDTSQAAYMNSIYQFAEIEKRYIDRLTIDA